MAALARSDDLAIAAATVGRFYGDGLAWALALPLHQLFHWHRIMRVITDQEPDSVG